MKKNIYILRRIKKLVTAIFLFALALGVFTIAYLGSLKKQGFTFAFFDVKILYLMPFLIFILALVLIIYDCFRYDINLAIRNENLKMRTLKKFKTSVGGYVPIICVDKSFTNLASFGTEEINFFLHLASVDKIEVIMKSKSQTEIFKTEDFVFFNKHFKPSQNA